MFNIFVVGPPRSGTTWLYNATKKILDAAEKEYYANFVKHINEGDLQNLNVVKAHYPKAIPKHLDPDLVLLIYRNPVDRICSLIRMGWLEDDDQTIIDRAVSSEKLFYYWKNFADVYLDYENIINTPIQCLSVIADALSVELEQDTLKRIKLNLENLQSPTIGAIDYETQMHKNHRNTSKIPYKLQDKISTLIEPAIINIREMFEDHK